MGIRDDNKQRIREQIISVAVELFRRQGLASTRVADIIREVGISEKTFFNYFPSKQAVLEAGVLDRGDLYGTALSDQVARRDLPPRRRLEEVVQVLAEAYGADREWFALLASETRLFFGSSGSQKARHEANQHLAADLFRQGQRSGGFRCDVPPAQMAELFTACVALTTVNWLLGWRPEEEPLTERLPRAAGIVLDGCSLPPRQALRSSISQA